MCLGALATVLRVWDDDGIRMAEIDRSGVPEVVSLLYLPEAVEGDTVLVHLGFPVQRVDPEVAEEARRLRREMGA